MGKWYMARGYPSLDLFNHNTTTNKDAKFKFINPTPLEITNETLREHPAFAFDMTPDVEEGDILIFPCWMLHCVEEQKTDGPRITAAGNFYEVLKEK